MPTYDYECTRCGELFELFQSMKDKPKRTLATKCKECRNKAPVVRRIGTGAAVIFKGSGFYQTDYRTESYKESAKKDTESGASADKKPETKSEAKPDPKSSEPSTPAKPADGAGGKPAKSKKPKSS